MTLNEVAPPTKKHERMVKHIKKTYKKDGKLTDDEKSIAYATAWKNYNKKESFEYEKLCRVVDDLTEEDAKLMAKCYAKLYLANLESLDEIS